jgi:hypothetical protein
VIIKNPGENMVILDLGTLHKGGENDFSELVLHRVGTTDEMIERDYKRLTGDTEYWSRVLIDAGSTKSMPFLVENPKQGLYHVEFTARLSDKAKKALIQTEPGTFNPDLPIWWNASAYLDFFNDNEATAKQTVESR